MAAFLPNPQKECEPRILVKNIPQRPGWNLATTADKLVIHFQKNKNGGAGNVTAVTFPKSMSELDQAIIEFEDSRTARSVLQHEPHRFGGEEMTVTEYKVQGLGCTQTEIPARTIAMLDASHNLEEVISFIATTAGVKISEDGSYLVTGQFYQVAAAADRINFLINGGSIISGFPLVQGLVTAANTEGAENASAVQQGRESTEADTASEAYEEIPVDEDIQEYLRVFQPIRMSTIGKKYKVIIEENAGKLMIKPQEKRKNPDVAGAKKTIVDAFNKCSNFFKAYVKRSEFSFATAAEVDKVILALRKNNSKTLLARLDGRKHRNGILILATSQREAEEVENQFRQTIEQFRQNKELFFHFFQGTKFSVSVLHGHMIREQVDAIILEVDPTATSWEPVEYGGSKLVEEWQAAITSMEQKQQQKDLLFLEAGNGQLQCNSVVLLLNDAKQKSAAGMGSVLLDAFGKSGKKGIRTLSIPMRYIGMGLPPLERREQVFEAIFTHAKEIMTSSPKKKLQKVNIILESKAEAAELIKDLQDRWIKNFTVTAGAVAAKPEEDPCAICLEELYGSKTAMKVLPCKHAFHQSCIDKAFRVCMKCPLCLTFFGKPEGNQPRNGRMDVKELQYSCSGYNCPTIEITYSFLNGTQGKEHPNPGKIYHGTHRVAYLPGNAQGRAALLLLRKAFDSRLTFTVGRSVTTGRDNCITWSDIHHKTSTHGGPSNYGYPDPGYLDRLKEELKAKGIE